MGEFCAPKWTAGLRGGITLTVTVTPDVTCAKGTKLSLKKEKCSACTRLTYQDTAAGDSYI